MDAALTGFILLCAFLVLFMTPGVSFFYGGMSRKKNVGNTIIMCFLALGLVGVLWCVEGFSVAFDGQFADTTLGQFIGGFSQLFLNGTDTTALSWARFPDASSSVPWRRFLQLGLFWCTVRLRTWYGAAV